MRKLQSVKGETHMKKAILMAFAVLLVTSAALSESIDLSGMETTELVELRQQIDKELSKRNRSSDEIVITSGAYYGELVYTGYTIENDCITVRFRWTNTTNKYQSYSDVHNLYFNYGMYQDGISLPSYSLTGDSDLFTVVQPGASIDFSFPTHKLRSTSDVEFIVTDIFSTDLVFYISFPVR